ncbi:predicted protein [Botrytis cinerea T4]|uniref:Uncharacterized protein n=1 Tax=Botryotinia fuckeliana (strain T4) TaxID=999810 RepID=G2YND4_BOTF4|nr:predicted protein [Botrytis cinerea T4]
MAPVRVKDKTRPEQGMPLPWYEWHTKKEGRSCSSEVYRRGLSTGVCKLTAGSRCFRCSDNVT